MEDEKKANTSQDTLAEVSTETNSAINKIPSTEETFLPETSDKVSTETNHTFNKISTDEETFVEFPEIEENSGVTKGSYKSFPNNSPSTRENNELTAEEMEGQAIKNNNFEGKILSSSSWENHNENDNSGSDGHSSWNNRAESSTGDSTSSSSWNNRKENNDRHSPSSSWNDRKEDYDFESHSSNSWDTHREIYNSNPSWNEQKEDANRELADKNRAIADKNKAISDMKSGALYAIPTTYTLKGIRSFISPYLLQALASTGWQVLYFNTVSYVYAPPPPSIALLLKTNIFKDEIAIVDNAFSTDENMCPPSKVRKKQKNIVNLFSMSSINQRIHSY